MIPQLARRCDLVVTRWGTWFHGRRLPSTIGRGGITSAKREGDGATPAGAYPVVAIRFRPDRVAAATLPRHATAIGPRDLWSDDPADPRYNHPVRAPHPFGHERLRRPDLLYDLILVTGWNHPDAAPGRGSAIFVHQWRRPHARTAGCLALSRANLHWIAARLTRHSRLIVKP